MSKKAKKTILITAGPTVEPIDPVRYISNYSTGMMGFELARAAEKRGYRVILISGPTSLDPPKGIRFISVKTASDMRKEVLKNFRRAGCIVMAAAVSDFRPAQVSKGKIKKRSKSEFYLKLKRNPDILTELARAKGRRILAGYSLETERPIENARKKLETKKLDIIVANRTGGKSSPFGQGRKKAVIISKNGGIKRLKAASKKEIAAALLDAIEKHNYVPGSS